MLLPWSFGHRDDPCITRCDKDRLTMRTGPRVGAVIEWRDTTLSAWLRGCEQALAAGADGLFIPDHTRVQDRFDTSHLSCAVALGAARAAFGNVAIGPLVARVGGGLDEHVLGMLDAVSDGEVVAALGIGDRNARLEHVVSELAWPLPNERWQRLCAVAQRCIDRGWETYAATDRVELACVLPDGVGVHVQNPATALFEGRRWAFGAFAEMDDATTTYVREAGFSWVCLAQLHDEPTRAFAARLEQLWRPAGI